MAYFPFFIDIQDKHCLVVGGGSVALRKVSVLMKFGVYVTVVAPEICEELQHLADKNGKLILLKREFESTDISQAFFVVAATNDPVINEAISVLCKESDTLVNVSDSKENSEFLFPSIVKRGDVVVGTSTSGNSPDVAKWVRTQIDWAIPGYVSELVESLGQYRIIIKDRIVSEQRRDLAFKELLYQGMKTEGKIDKSTLEKIIKQYQSE